MKPTERLAYIRRYEEQKRAGSPLFPYALVRDAQAGFAVILILAVLAWIFDAPLGPPADPGDGSATPVPEWYFYFLFQLLRYLPGNLEIVGVFYLPAAAILLMLALPILDRSSRRHISRRPVMAALTAGVLTGFLFLTVQGALTVAGADGRIDNDEAADPVAWGAQIYATYCSACHGPDGRGGPNPATPGDLIPSIRSIEYLGTRDDDTIRAVIEQGQPSLGMGAFGSAYGGALGRAEVDALLAFVRSRESSA